MTRHQAQVTVLRFCADVLHTMAEWPDEIFDINNSIGGLGMGDAARITWEAKELSRSLEHRAKVVEKKYVPSR